MFLSEIGPRITKALHLGGPRPVALSTPPLAEPTEQLSPAALERLRMSAPDASTTDRPPAEALHSVSAAPSASILDRVAQAFSVPYIAAAIPDRRSLDDAPIRTYAADDQGRGVQVDFGTLSPQRIHRDRATAERFHKVSKADLEKALEQAKSARGKMLHNLAHAKANGRVVPKDATLNPSTFIMSYGSDDSVSLAFIRQMGRIGQVEGFKVIAEAARDEVRDVKDELEPKENVTVVNVPGNRDVWVEDHGEVTVDRQVSVPAFVGDQTLIDDAIYRDRLRRFHPDAQVDASLTGTDLSDEIAEKYPDVDFSMLGAVDDRRNQESLLALGLSGDLEVRQNLTYVEGGNVLPGSLGPKEGYALVGRDSVAVSKALLERDVGHRLTEGQTLRAMARDLGIKPENLHPVEQPGEFHIDMRMGLLGPGEVLLNDAREAARLQEQWLRDDSREPAAPPPGASWLKRAVHRVKHAWWKHFTLRRLESTIESLHEEGERRAKFEDRTLADVRAAGLKAYRIAGVFVDPYDPKTDVANFVNCRPGTGDDGKRFFVALGGEPRAEAYVARTLIERIPSGIARVHFLDRALTRETLDLSGGIKCRSKTAGEVVA